MKGYISPPPHHLGVLVVFSCLLRGFAVDHSWVCWNILGFGGFVCGYGGFFVDWVIVTWVWWYDRRMIVDLVEFSWVRWKYPGFGGFCVDLVSFSWISLNFRGISVDCSWIWWILCGFGEIVEGLVEFSWIWLYLR